MEESEKIKQRFELLKMARELLNEDYINRRAEDHNKWVADNEESWRTTRRNIPYPPFAQYPTDNEIVQVASTLYNFIYTQGERKNEINTILEIGEIKESTNIGKPIPEADDVFPRKKQIRSNTRSTKRHKTAQQIESNISDTNLETADSKIETSDTSAPDGINLVDKFSRNLLPGWVRRSKHTD